MSRVLVSCGVLAGVTLVGRLARRKRHKNVDLEPVSAATPIVEEEPIVPLPVSDQPSRTQLRTYEFKQQRAGSSYKWKTILQIVLYLGIVVGTAMYKPQMTLLSSILCQAAFLLFLLISRSTSRKAKESEEANSRDVLEASDRPVKVDAWAGLKDFTGTWHKDPGASDSMDEASRLMRLNRIMRLAIRLVKTIKIEQTDEDFKMTILSGILWFKVVEKYPLSGEPRQFKRRDMRKGNHVGNVEGVLGGNLRLNVTWQEPLGGSGHDDFFLPHPNEMHVYSTITVAGESVSYRSVYHRSQ